MEYEVPNIETQSHCIRSSEDEHLVKEVEVTLNTKRDSKCSHYSITIEPLMFVVVLSDILLGTYYV